MKFISIRIGKGTRIINLENVEMLDFSPSPMGKEYAQFSAKLINSALGQIIQIKKGSKKDLIAFLKNPKTNYFRLKAVIHKDKITEEILNEVKK